jgi:hypothetical protein
LAWKGNIYQFKQGRVAHILGVGAGDALRDGSSDRVEKPCPIRGEFSARGLEVHWGGRQQGLSVFIKIRVAHKLRAIHCSVVRKEIHIIR